MLLNPYRFGVSTLLGNLVSYWRLDELSGNAIDELGVNNLIPSAAIGSDPSGKIGRARSFNGQNLSLVSASLTTGDVDFTISLWAKAASFPAFTVIVCKFLAASHEFNLRNNGASFGFAVNLGQAGSNTVSAPVTPQLGVWYHFICWHDSVNNQIGIMVNGGAPTVAAHTVGVIANSTAPFVLGQGGEYWYGLIDEVGYWRRVLTPAERTALYNNGGGRTYPFDGPDYIPPPLFTGLISYWKLDEASGNAIDAHGTNHLTDNNTVASAAGKIGTARDFELSNSEWLSCASNSTLQTGDIEFTFSLWIKSESLGAVQIILGKDNGGSSREYLLNYDTGSNRYALTLFPNGTATGAAAVFGNALGAPSIGVWYFIVIWHDPVANKIYMQINNGGIDEASISGTFVGTAQFILGALDNSGSRLPFDGLIDEVGFWKRVLTPAERTQLYNSGNGLAYPFT